VTLTVNAALIAVQAYAGQPAGSPQAGGAAPAGPAVRAEDRIELSPAARARLQPSPPRSAAAAQTPPTGPAVNDRPSRREAPFAGIETAPPAPPGAAVDVLA